jgi:hypothetical protein
LTEAETTQFSLTITTAPTHTAPAEPVPAVPPTTTLESKQLVERTDLLTKEQPASGDDEQKNLDTQLITEAGPKPGWKVAQAGLGVILAGLLIAIIWLRLKARAG